MSLSHFIVADTYLSSSSRRADVIIAISIRRDNDLSIYSKNKLDRFYDYALEQIHSTRKALNTKNSYYYPIK